MDAKHKVLTLQKKQELAYLPHREVNFARRQPIKKNTNAVQSFSDAVESLPIVEKHTLPKSRSVSESK